MELKSFWPGWETVRLIGQGGFSKVYEIKKSDEAGEYRAALKVITVPQSPDEYQSYVDDGYDEKSITAIFKSQIEEIVSEMQLMSQFKGISNIVSYEDHMIVPHADGRGWDILIRMELLTNLPMYYAEHNGMSEDEVIRLGIDINNALEMCEQKNIVHRDIKPQNLFINEFGIFKLGDFGIAKTMEHTTKATKVGTYSYMAPEVYSNKPYGTQADQYSLGMVLYWLMNERRLPFQPLPPVVPTPSENSEAHLRRMNGEQFPAPKNASPELAQVILKACSFKPEERYKNSEEFKSALESAGAFETSRIISPRVSTGEKNTNFAGNRCSVCGEPLSPHAAICKKCGAGTGITIGKFDTICPECGCVTALNSVFCSVCGKKMVKEKPKEEPPKSLFCFCCGRPLPSPGAQCPYCSTVKKPDPIPQGSYVQRSNATYTNPQQKNIPRAKQPQPQPQRTVRPAPAPAVKPAPAAKPAPAVKQQVKQTAAAAQSTKPVIKYLILSIVGLCLSVLSAIFVALVPAAGVTFSLAGLVVSFISLIRINKADYSLSGSNMMGHAKRLSIGGLVAGGVLLILSIILVATVGPVMPMQMY